MRHPSTFLLSAFLTVSLPALILVGCASKSERDARRAEGSYELGELPDWERIKDPGGADYAWVKTSSGAVIFADSNCGPRYSSIRVTPVCVDVIFFGVVGVEFPTDQK